MSRNIEPLGAALSAAKRLEAALVWECRDLAEDPAFRAAARRKILLALADYRMVVLYEAASVVCPEFPCWDLHEDPDCPAGEVRRAIREGEGGA